MSSSKKELSKKPVNTQLEEKQSEMVDVVAKSNESTTSSMPATTLPPMNPVVNTTDIESQIPDTPILKILKKIHVNCVFFTIYHNKRFWMYKNVLFLVFRMPLIILSAFNSFFAVGMQDLMPQTTISMANALISLFCGILTSIELFLNLNKKMEVELTTYKSFYTLGIDIYQFIETTNFNTAEPNKQKSIDDRSSEMYNRYKELVNASNAINIYNINFKDSLELTSEIPDKDREHVITTNKYCCNTISCCKEVCLCCP